jgi:hypothetical protein
MYQIWIIMEGQELAALLAPLELREQHRRTFRQF